MTLSGFGAARLVIISFLTLFVFPAGAQQTRLKELNEEALRLYREGKLTQAAQVEMDAVHNAEIEFGPQHLTVGLALANACSIYKDNGQFADAVEICKRSLAILEKYYGPNHHQVALALNNLGLVYAGMQRYPEAEPFYERALRNEELSNGPNNPQTAAVLLNLGAAYMNESRFAESESMYQRAIAIDEKGPGKETSALAEALNNLAELRKLQGRYSDAEQVYKRSLTIREKLDGQDSRAVATLDNNLAALYDDEGKFGVAEGLYRRALAIDEKILGADHPDLAIDLNNLAQICFETGRYAEAEPLYRQALAIREKTLGSDNTTVGMSLNNIADLYKAQGKFEDAEALLLRALAIEEKALGPQDTQVATVANNLGGLYHSRGRFQEAEPLFERAIAIDKRALGAENPKVATDLNNLALLYSDQGRLNEAEPLFKQTLSINEKAFGAEHEKVATALNNLGSLYNSQGRFAESEAAYLRALRIDEKTFGPDHPSIENTTTNIAVLYDSQGKYAEAEPYFQRALGILFEEFQYNFTYMTEKDRLNFLNSVKTRFPTYFSFVYRYRRNDPKLIGSMYNLLLWQKGFVATSITQLRREIEGSGDPQAIAMLGQLAEIRSQIAALLGAASSNPENLRPEIERLKTEADEIEKKLVARSAAFREDRKLERATWQQVRDRLRPGEAAVEFARFRYFDNGWRDHWFYVALVVRPETRYQPQFIDLGEDKPVDAAAHAALEDTVATRGLSTDATITLPGHQLYESLWKPLAASLQGAKRIYLSSDGALNEVPLGLIPLPGGQLVMERYDLRLVSSTKDILRNDEKPGPPAALLIGDPDFGLSEQEEQIAIEKLGAATPDPASKSQNTPAASAQSRTPDQNLLPRLPGTGEEVDSIARMMKSRGWRVAAYTRELALKSALEKTSGPRVLHLATHGFFKAGQQHVANQDLLEDPMLRSGLYFAGADRTLSGSNSGLDNGVLTALEAGNLNLSGTELVVLSACDTGWGEVQDGEGVFGLRRAFEEAGAHAVLMSLWSVPDNETQELMREFYMRWLRGVEMHEALKQAQLTMRDRLRKQHGGRDLPYYWGAFVLVGK